MRISDWSSDVCSSDLDFEPLQQAWDRVFDAIEPAFGKLKWINMGGGHHITRADYQREELVEFLRDAREDTGAEIYLEPGEAVALDAGILVGTILDSDRKSTRLNSSH